MKIHKGLLDYSDWELPDLYMFTGNPILKNNGAIVMGRGAAKEVRDTYPGIDQAFGTAVRDRQGSNILFVKLAPKKIIGWFKVKNHWQQEAKLPIIEASVHALTAQAVANPQLKFHLNYPGIGNGKLTEDDVSPLLTQLPDNVIIYK